MPKKTMEDFWIEMGWYKEVYDRTAGKKVRRLTNGRWKDDEQTQQYAIRFLVDEVLHRDPRDVTDNDFYRNRLSGLLTGYYRGSPYQALVEAGYEIEPWEMSETPHDFYKDSDNRIAATRWFVERLGKDPRDIIAQDFNRNALWTLKSPLQKQSL